MLDCAPAVFLQHTVSWSDVDSKPRLLQLFSNRASISSRVDLELSLIAALQLDTCIQPVDHTLTCCVISCAHIVQMFRLDGSE